MQYVTFPTTWQGDGFALPFEPDMTNAPAPPTGYYQVIANHPPDFKEIGKDVEGNAIMGIVTPTPGDPVTVTLTYAPIPTPEEKAAFARAAQGSPPPPDVPGFRRSIPLDASVPAADQSALMSDPRAGQFLWALQDNNWAFAQTLYNSMKASPGTGYTTADVESFGSLAVAHYIPITP